MSKLKDTKTHLIHTMAALLQKQGYASTGISQVLKKSGITSGSLYYHFPDGKEGLAAAAIDFMTDEFMNNLIELSRDAKIPTDVLRLVIYDFINNLENSNFRKGGSITNATLELSDELPLLQKAVSNYYKRIEDFCVKLFTQNGWTEEGAATLAQTLIASIEGATVLCRARRDTEPLRSILRWSDNYFSERF